jgi:Kdo2-lipid IVA lauroyltransferase/acyltransferase
MYTVWFGNAAKIEKKMLITGEHYLTQALDQKKGVVLLSAHFTTLELPFCWLKRIGINTGAMYREQKNTSWNQVMHQGRSRHINHLFRHIDIKSLVSALKEGMVVWYAPDQHYAKKRSVTLPFFGQMTSFNSAIENIQQVTNCIVLTQFSRQLPTGEYEIAFGPPLTATLDNLITTQYVKCLESFILKAPEQYYWVHKRFK